MRKLNTPAETLNLKYLHSTNPVVFLILQPLQMLVCRWVSVMTGTGSAQANGKEYDKGLTKRAKNE